MSIWYCLNDASRAMINPSIDARVRDTPSVSVWLTTDATCGNSSTGYSDAPTQKKVTALGLYITPPSHQRHQRGRLSALPAPTTMMLPRSASIAYTICWDSSGMSMTPTGNIRPGFAVVDVPWLAAVAGHQGVDGLGDFQRLQPEPAR